MSSQRKAITKTVLIIVAIMVAILAMFINKITTPRYLSDIELKINGLDIILKEQRQSVDASISGDYWMLLASDIDDKTVLDDLHRQLKSSVREKVVVVYHSASELKAGANIVGKVIPIIKPSGEFLGYFSYPYDQHKMILTLSSVVTHR